MLQKIAVRVSHRHLGVLAQTGCLALISLFVLFLPNYLNFGYSVGAPSLWQLVDYAEDAVTGRFMLAMWPLSIIQGLMITLPLVVFFCAGYSRRFTRWLGLIAASVNFGGQMVLAVVTNRMCAYICGDFHMSMQMVGAGTWLCVGTSLWLLLLTLIPVIMPEDVD
jgi:hypothetical protein